MKQCAAVEGFREVSHVWAVQTKTDDTPGEEQIRVLAECGIRLRPGMTIEHLLSSSPREEYETAPYDRLIWTMGGSMEEEPFQRFSDDIWHFDTESIYADGDYAAIAERLRDLAGGDLPLAAVADHVDTENGEAWLSFVLDGHEMLWEAEVNDDWVDPTILTRFAELMAGRPTEKRFIICSGRQDVLLGYSTPERLRDLSKRTGLRFEWLS